MIKIYLSKIYIFLLVLIGFWVTLGGSFKGEASAVPDVGEQSGRVSFESQELYEQEVARLENGDHTGLSIQFRKILRSKRSWLLAVLLLWALWRNYLPGRFWCHVVLKKAKKEVSGAFVRRGPPLKVKFY